MANIQQTMTTTEVQALLHLGSAAAARVQLRRWGIEAVARALDGEKLWPAKHVRQRATNRPGRGARTDLKRAAEKVVVNQEDTMDRVISLNPWQDGQGWVWEIENSEGVVRRSRTDTNCQGLYGQTRPGEEWGQSLGHMQITWPEDREAMIRRLAQPRNGNPGLDISALRA